MVLFLRDLSICQKLDLKLISFINSFTKLEKEKASRDKQLEALTEDLNNKEDAFTKLSKEKKSLEEALQEQTNATQIEEDKLNQMTRAKKKVDDTLHEVR